MAEFQPAVAEVFRHEGGYVNHPADPGGPTNMGITLETMREALGGRADLDGDGDVDADDVKRLPSEEAEHIYRERYWDRPGFGQIADQRVATKLFDLGVNAHPRVAITLLQRALNYFPPYRPRVVDDGVLGPITLAAANAADPDLLLRAISSEQKLFYLRCIDADPEKEVFRRGWLARASWIPGDGRLA